MTDTYAGPPSRHGDRVECAVGVDSAAGDDVAIEAGVDAAAGDKSAAGPTSMTVCGLWVVEVDVDAGDSDGDAVASSAVGDMTAAGDSAAAEDCAGDGCSPGENGVDDNGCAIGEACGVAERLAGDGDEAASAARSEESSAAEDVTDCDDCAAGDGCIEADDAGGSASGASPATFGVTCADGMPGGDPAMAVDAAFADEALLAVDAPMDMLAGDGTPALVAIRLTADAGLAPSSLALSGAFNGATADDGIDDSVIPEDTSGRISSGPCDSRA